MCFHKPSKLLKYPPSIYLLSNLQLLRKRRQVSLSRRPALPQMVDILGERAQHSQCEQHPAVLPCHNQGAGHKPHAGREKLEYTAPGAQSI